MKPGETTLQHWMAAHRKSMKIRGWHSKGTGPSVHSPAIHSPYTIAQPIYIPALHGMLRFMVQANMDHWDDDAATA